jgi:hypothetical protein
MIFIVDINKYLWGILWGKRLLSFYCVFYVGFQTIQLWHNQESILPWALVRLAQVPVGVEARTSQKLSMGCEHTLLGRMA